MYFNSWCRRDERKALTFGALWCQKTRMMLFSIDWKIYYFLRCSRPERRQKQYIIHWLLCFAAFPFSDLTRYFFPICFLIRWREIEKWKHRLRLATKSIIFSVIDNKIITNIKTDEKNFDSMVISLTFGSSSILLRYNRVLHWAWAF